LLAPHFNLDHTWYRRSRFDENTLRILFRRASPRRNARRVSCDPIPAESHPAPPPNTSAAKIYAAGWWLALAVFAGLGLWQWVQDFRPVSPGFGEPDAGLDALARERFGIDHGAAVLRREMASVPPDYALFVIGPGNNWTLTEAYYLISYLAWPRPVWCIGAVPPGQHARFDNPPPPGLKPAVAFLYELSAPPGAPAHRYSEHLTVMHSPE